MKKPKDGMKPNIKRVKHTISTCCMSEALGSEMDTGSSCSTGDMAIDAVFPVVYGGLVVSLLALGSLLLRTVGYIKASERWMLCGMTEYNVGRKRGTNPRTETLEE